MKKIDKKERLVELVLPIVAILMAWLAVVVATVVGVWLSLSKENWSIFARSGSIVVAVALLLAIYDHFSWARSLSELARGVVKNEGVEDMFIKDIREALLSHGIEKAENEIGFLAEQKSKSYYEMFPYRFSYHLKSLFQKNELLIGIYGTLIWGFGDLIGKLL